MRECASNRAISFTIIIHSKLSRKTKRHQKSKRKKRRWPRARRHTKNDTDWEKSHKKDHSRDICLKRKSQIQINNHISFELSICDLMLRLDGILENFWLVSFTYFDWVNRLCVHFVVERFVFLLVCLISQFDWRNAWCEYENVIAECFLALFFSSSLKNRIWLACKRKNTNFYLKTLHLCFPKKINPMCSEQKRCWSHIRQLGRMTGKAMNRECERQRERQKEWKRGARTIYDNNFRSNFIYFIRFNKFFPRCASSLMIFAWYQSCVWLIELNWNTNDIQILCLLDIIRFCSLVSLSASPFRSLTHWLALVKGKFSFIKEMKRQWARMAHKWMHTDRTHTHEKSNK